MAMKIKKSHRGMLHEDLGVPSGKKVPLADLMRAKRSKSAAVRKRATFAANARKWGK